jgi:hypothetical protein
MNEIFALMDGVDAELLMDYKTVADIRGLLELEMQSDHSIGIVIFDAAAKLKEIKKCSHWMGVRLFKPGCEPDSLSALADDFLKWRNSNDGCCC